MASSSSSQAVQGASARFVTGSTMRHVVVMTASGAVGLMAVFFVDVINLFYLSLLGEAEITAAMGYASTLLFFMMSLSIGLMIGVTALVSRALGAGNQALARRQATSGLVLSALAMLVLTALVMPFQTELLMLLRASGRALHIADHFLSIVMPTNAIIMAGMALSGILRGLGDARWAMLTTLGGGLATAILDPVFIFLLDLGVTGAAIVAVISRAILLGIGFHAVAFRHRLLEKPKLAGLREDAPFLFRIAFPAILTNLATPTGNAYVTSAIGGYGDDAVAAWAVIGRLFPLAFAGIFALSGSVGGIFGQNLGAQRLDRVEGTLRDSLIFTLAYVFLIWMLLLFSADWIAASFKATEEAARLIDFFCAVVAPTLVFTGALFVANAAFNNLGFPIYSTLFNWGRSTIGVVPFCWLGAQIAGAEGILLGWGTGGIFFGIAAVITAFRAVRGLGRTLEATAKETEKATAAPS